MAITHPLGDTQLPPIGKSSSSDGKKLWRGAIALMLCGTAVGACGQGGAPGDNARKAGLQATIARTSYGVVHVKAADFRGLGYGLAYSYAQDNVCMFADSLLTVRGERSRYFGPDAKATAPKNGEYGAAIDHFDLTNQDSDFFFKGYLDIEELRAGYQSGSAEARAMLAGYAAGYNRYLKDYAGKLPAACAGAAWVKPITVDDVYLVLAEKALHASGEVFAREIVAAANGRAAAATKVTQADFIQQRLARLTASQLGSNALALGKDSSANGRGLLFGSPHYPWTSTDRFYQAHLTVPGRYDAMGVILGGIPIVVIGFNRDVAWTHTVTTAAHFTTFKLQLDPKDASGTSYLIDGKSEKMRERRVVIDVLQPDGKLIQRSSVFYFTRQGAVMVKPEAGMAWTSSEVHVLGDPNRNNTRLIEQWIGIGSAHSVDAIKTALDKTMGLPWVNTIAADREGRVLFADASVVPAVKPERFASNCLLMPALLMFDGSRKQCGWAAGDIMRGADGPWTMRTDYVGNSNDSYWLSNTSAMLSGPAPFGYSPLYGPVAVPQKLRTRIGFKQLGETLGQKGRLAQGDLEQLAFANRIYAAELVLPALLQACDARQDLIVRHACLVLEGWDRRADLDSRGAILFREFWNRAAGLPGLWSTPFDPRDPVNTPAGVSVQALPALLQALHAAALQMHALDVPLDARLGDYQTETRNGLRIGIHGAIGDIDGSYNSIHMRSELTREGYRDVAWGTSYVQTVGFDANGPVAHGMLLYGQSVDPGSPYFADQLPLYARKQWPSLPFSEEDVRRDLNFSSKVLSE